MPKAVVANDHGAVELTAKIIAHLRERGYEVTYLGTDENKSVDYPDKAYEAVCEFRKGGYEFGVLCCGTGIGISLAANKMKGIRCALPQDIFAATMAHEHNNANFIAFGGRITYKDDVLAMLDAYIDTKPSAEERHINRVAKLMALENK